MTSRRTSRVPTSGWVVGRRPVGASAPHRGGVARANARGRGTIPGGLGRLPSGAPRGAGSEPLLPGPYRTGTTVAVTPTRWRRGVREARTTRGPPPRGPVHPARVRSVVLWSYATTAEPFVLPGRSTVPDATPRLLRGRCTDDPRCADTWPPGTMSTVASRSGTAVTERTPVPAGGLGRRSPEFRETTTTQPVPRVARGSERSSVKNFTPAPREYAAQDLTPESCHAAWRGRRLFSAARGACAALRAGSDSAHGGRGR